MLESFTTLFIISCVAFISPLLSYVSGGTWVRASAVIILLGWLLGPHALGWIHPSAYGIDLLQQLGLAFLFLMGGYSMEYDALKSPAGKHSVLAWVFSVALGLVAAFFVIGGFSITAGIAFALALTATSLPKVNAELKGDTGLSKTFVDTIESYGASGELLPVLAFALLLGDHNMVVEGVILAIFVGAALLGRRLVRAEEHDQGTLARFVENKEFAAEQLTIALLIGLVALGVLLGADMLVAGFAAGYILRQIAPNPNSKAVLQLRGISNGFFIPLTFVLSGASLDLGTAFVHTPVMLGFIALLLVVRGLPVLCSLACFKETRALDVLQKVSVAAYACMTMSTVVAMSDVALETGDMSAPIAATLIGAAAILNIVLPVVCNVLERIDAKRHVAQDH